MTEVKSSGAEPPAAMKVAPATSSEQPITSMMTSSAGTKNWADERGGIQHKAFKAFKLLHFSAQFQFHFDTYSSIHSELWKLESAYFQTVKLSIGSRPSSQTMASATNM